MPRGGRRPGAGRKAGSPSRPKVEIEKDRAYQAMKRAARAAKKAEREKAADQAAEARQAKAEKRAERIVAEILPPIRIDMPADVEPLDFLKGLMRNPELPVGFRRDCAALALPYAHVKPILGLKHARRLAAYDDEFEGDDIAAAMRE